MMASRSPSILVVRKNIWLLRLRKGKKYPEIYGIKWGISNFIKQKENEITMMYEAMIAQPITPSMYK